MNISSRHLVSNSVQKALITFLKRTKDVEYAKIYKDQLHIRGLKNIVPYYNEENDWPES